MNPSPFAVSPNTHVSQVFNLFRTMGLRHLPVVNAVGEVSPHSILSWPSNEATVFVAMLSTFDRIKISFNIKEKCLEETRMWFTWGPEALLIALTLTPSFGSKPVFPAKGRTCNLYPVSGAQPWTHQRLLIWLPLWRPYSRPRAEFPVCWGRRFFCWKGTCFLLWMVCAWFTVRLFASTMFRNSQ